MDRSITIVSRPSLAVIDDTELYIHKTIRKVQRCLEKNLRYYQFDSIRAFSVICGIAKESRYFCKTEWNYENMTRKINALKKGTDNIYNRLYDCCAEGNYTKSMEILQKLYKVLGYLTKIYWIAR